MCKKRGESIDHLLIHCEVARELCSSILNLLGMKWVMPRWVIDLLVSCGGQVGRGTVMGVWRLAPSCLMWCLWKGMLRALKM
jgi:hypothetical protein